jgi:hypothetical protein
MNTHTQKQIDYRKSMAYLNLSIDLENLENETRKRIGLDFGKCEGMNPFPVSGGICDHWPQSKKDELIEVVHAKQDAWDDSLKHWLMSGKQAKTWRAVKCSSKEAIFID